MAKARRGWLPIWTLVGLTLSGLAYPQSYPVRAVRIIVPFAPGGGSDIMARAMAPHVSELLGQQLIIDNRPGAGTIIGAELAARSAPDGYTLFLGITGTMAINPGLYAKLPYDPVRDFAPVVLVGTGPNVLVVHPSLPARSIGELISLAKAHPGKLSYAGTPKPIIATLNAVIAKVMMRIDVGQQLAAQGYEPLTSTPEELAARVTSDIAKWSKVIRDAKIPRESS